MPNIQIRHTRGPHTKPEVDQMPEVPLEVCQQMYKALLRVSQLPAGWGGEEVRNARDVACQYMGSEQKSDQ